MIVTRSRNGKHTTHFEQAIRHMCDTRTEVMHGLEGGTHDLLLTPEFEARTMNRQRKRKTEMDALPAMFQRQLHLVRAYAAYCTFKSQRDLFRGLGLKTTCT